MSGDGRHSDHEDCGGNAAPYVLGALTESEHEAFRVHMESCAVCREEVAALQVVAAALPGAAPQVSAPPELKRRVMTSVREDERRQRSAASSASSARAREGRTGRAAWWRPALATVAVAAAVIAVLAIALGKGSGSQPARVIRAEVHVAHAHAWLSVRSGRAQLTIADMPQSPRGRVYELWVERAGRPVATDTLFTVTSAGGAAIGVPGSVNGVTAVMVTSEPLGGSLAPTTSPVIVAPLS